MGRAGAASSPRSNSGHVSQRRARARCAGPRGSPIEFLETDRLYGEPLRAELAAELAELLLDPMVYPWLWEESEPPTREAVLWSAEQAQAHWERFGFGLWLLRDRASGALIGRGGLRWTGLREVPNVEVGWAIVSGRWGQGLATELAHESIKLGFEELGVDELVAYTQPHNVASRRVMEKTGFAFDRDFIVDGLPQVLYRRER